ncbi:hypothetical protein F5Y19DRAFT_477901 [Xylariaceae sp. FL1651]|nr:hypothetical protein F5Y19DRAFT_477901 [Xylariaceae sp. FL1651]
MAVLEIVQPQLKRDAEVIKDIEANVVPIMQKLLTDGGVLNGLRGWFVTEDGRDVRNEFREILVLEWPAAQYFTDFVASPGFQGLMGTFREKGYATGPPSLKLFDAGDLSVVFGSHTVLEYLAIKPQDASDANVQGVRQKLESSLQKLGSPRAVVGSSTNLDAKEIAVVGVYASDAELDAAKASTARQEFLAEIGKVANVTSLVAHVKKELPLASQ